MMPLASVNHLPAGLAATPQTANTNTSLPTLPGTRPFISYLDPQPTQSRPAPTDDPRTIVLTQDPISTLEFRLWRASPSSSPPPAPAPHARHSAAPLPLLGAGVVERPPVSLRLA